MWFSHGESNARGVAIAFKKGTDVTIHNVIHDIDGRFLILYTTYHRSKVLMINVYAPNQDRPDFFVSLFKEVARFSADYMILAGDFNLGLNPLVDRRGKGLNNNRAAKVVNAFISSKDLIDVWRYAHPDESGFTWRKLRPSLVFSRLDYCIVNSALEQFIDSIKLVPGFRTDHSLLQLEINFATVIKGPGYWKFNTTFLQDQNYVEKMNNLLDIELESNELSSFRKKWEQIKLTARGSTIQFASRKAKAKRKLIEIYELKIKRLEHELLNRNPLFHDTEQQIWILKHELQESIREKTRGAILRAKADWALYGEKPTKYFLNLEKQKFISKTLYRVKNSQNEIIDEPEMVLQEIKNYFKQLYTSKGPISKEYLKKLQMPQISNYTPRRVLSAKNISKNYRSPKQESPPA